MPVTFATALPPLATVPSDFSSTFAAFLPFISIFALAAGSAKIEMKGKKAAKVELKSDGTVASGGKAVAKVTGMTMQSADGGKKLLNFGSDGAGTTGARPSYW